MRTDGYWYGFGHGCRFGMVIMIITLAGVMGLFWFFMSIGLTPWPCQP